MDAIIDKVLEVVLNYGTQIIGAVLVAMFAFAVSQLRKLPNVMRDFAEELASKAAMTPTKADDVAAELIKAGAEALAEAIERSFPRKG